ncbi:glycosyltransferase family 2 protein [Flavobacterium sp.]|uniref:glycosyltransferase family 2 protein n=1 Tax=Flavobacterium sp. TaxID=239 RepID=UPI00260F2B4E|nr:glycosyltransferase family 2 protein [Flavobacterium sp.]
MNFSFFIPTYKRDVSLRECISSIYKYWNIEDLKIIISDNNETDIAKSVVEEFDLNYIVYSSNSTNIGIDRNMLQFLNLCKNKYCWLLGDDDSLNKKSYDLISPFLKENLDFIILLNDNFIKEFPDGVYDISNPNDAGKAFLAFWDKLPFGNVIINVQQAKCLDFKNDVEKYIGTSHAYSAVLWELALSPFSTGKFGVITTKTVNTIEVKKTWADSSVSIHLKEIPIWFELLPKSISSYTSKAYKKYLKLIFSPSFLLGYFHFIRQNKQNKHLFRKLLQNKPFIYIAKTYFAFLFFSFYPGYRYPNK